MYQDLDHAVQESLHLLESISTGETGTIWYAKTDVQSAFCLLPLGPWTYWILIMQAKHPNTKRMYYFVDKCLPFGHSISCALFQAFSNALAHMTKFLIRINWKIHDPALTNYLDDFLFAALLERLCNEMLDQFLTMCKHLGVPISMEKMEFATVRIVFLGILLDGELFVLVVLEEKRIKTINLLQSFLHRKKATVRDIQGLAGLLNFLHKAVFPGRAFSRRMYAKFSEIIDSKGNKIASTKLKPHHHIHLDSEFKLDCSMWLNFLLKLDREVKGLSCPFTDMGKMVNAKILHLFTDVAKGETLGMGGVFQHRWFFAQWEHNYIKDCDPSMEYLELLGLCTAIFCWGELLRNQRVILFCDNQAVVTMVNNTTAKGKNCMILIRMLVTKCLEYNMRIFSRWVKGSKNTRADLLSRQKIDKFMDYVKSMNIRVDSSPTKLPVELWPLSRIWVKDIRQ